MMVKTFGSAVYGIDAITISIEVSWTPKGRMYFIVGLPDNAIRESFQRIESAIKGLELHMPRTKIVVNMAPADIRKSGSAFDLPIAIGILAASGQLKNADAVADYVIMGELGLDGSVRSIKGALPIAMQSRKENFKGLIIPKANAREAGILNQLNVYGVEHIRDVVEFFEGGRQSLLPTIVNTREEFFLAQEENEGDFSEVKGQENIKRALEIAAAGGHNCILIGPPGAGKTMLAKRMPSILPPLTLPEALETTRIHSVAGKLQANSTLVSRRPFRNPHHTISSIALVGGGAIPHPGEISLAHNGVLFLDELPEFQRTVLEVMRQPMEDRKITINRTHSGIEFPASFMLIASMNPCPCGYFNHPDKDCSCPPGAVQKYLQRISGPLMDRIDLHVEVTPLPFADLYAGYHAESSATIRERVTAARKIQQERFMDQPGIFANAQMGSTLLHQHAELCKASTNLLRTAMEKLRLSTRAHDRILKVSRTIADLADSEKLKPEHIAEAIQYRSLDRERWMA
ncbi:MAG: YifB family Mg chelatase-like AAA ATPase [Chitinophagaceae bacterium]